MWITYPHNSETGDNLWIRSGLYIGSYPQNVDKVIPMLSLMGITFFAVDNLSPFPVRLSPITSIVIHRFWHTQRVIYKAFRLIHRLSGRKREGWRKRGYPHIHSPYCYGFIIYFIKKEKK
jgi:hypothetical protein